jgi:hypothetical protein
LGVQDLATFGYALRTKWEWLRRTNPGKLWVQLPAISDPKVAALFEASLLVSVGDGGSNFFWSDNWMSGKFIKLLAPHLYNVVSKRK